MTAASTMPIPSPSGWTKQNPTKAVWAHYSMPKETNFSLGNPFILSGSGSSQGLSTSVVKASAPPATEQVVAEHVAAIKTHLSLSMTDLAAVLSVQRPTVYAWLAGEQMPHNSNLERLERLKRLAEAASDEAKEPLPDKLARVSVDGVTLLGLLSHDDTTPDEIRTHVHTLRERIGAQPRGVFRTIAERHGRQLQEPEGGQERIDVLTGRPTS